MYPSLGDRYNGADSESRSQQTTPPLVFMTQSTGTPRLPDNSPCLEPLHITSYSAVLGGNELSLSSSTALPHAGSTHMHIGDSPIRITCRTRDGRRSPILTHPVGDFQIGPEVTRGMPYGYSFSNRSTPVQATSPSFPALQQPQPHAQPTQPPPTGSALWYADGGRTTESHPVSPVEMPAASLPATVVHRTLAGRCRFVPFPSTLLSADAASGRGKHAGANSTGVGAAAGSNDSNGQQPLALFIGQVRFETTAAELIWLVHRTSGAVADHLEGRGAGCYLLYCKSEADMQLVRSLHKRILFDNGGVWLARTAEEIDALCEYVALDAPLLSRKAHLPRDSMVVEDLKRDALSHNSGGGGGRMGPRNGGPAPPSYGDYRGRPLPPGSQRGQAPPGYGTAPPYGYNGCMPCGYPGAAPMYGHGGGGNGNYVENGTQPPPPPPPYQGSVPR